MANLETNYLGLNLKNPLIIGSSGLTGSIENIKKISKYNPGAIVLKSLFEEQIMVEAYNILEKNEIDYPDIEDYIIQYTKNDQVNSYLKLIKEAKNNVSFPVIASINCFTNSEWIGFASKIEEAGADALELNISLMPSNPKLSSQENEEIYLKIAETVKNQIKIPVALKISYYSAGLANLITKLSYSKYIDSLVLFNRYYSPDIDITSLKYISSNAFSNPADISDSLRWIALMSGKIKMDLASSTGVHDSKGLIKQLLVGAKAVQVVSTIYKNGPEQITKIIDGLNEWMDKNNYDSIEKFRGKLNYSKEASSSVFERSQFMKHYNSII